MTGRAAWICLLWAGLVTTVFGTVGAAIALASDRENAREMARVQERKVELAYKAKICTGVLALLGDETPNAVASPRNAERVGAILGHCLGSASLSSAGTNRGADPASTRRPE